jgi:hypothetical protein
MKLKKILAVGLTVAAIASCVVVPTVMAGTITRHEGGVYTVRPKGYILTQMQGYVTATVSGYQEVDCYMIQDRYPATVARKTYNAYNGRRAYYSKYANKSSHIYEAGISGHSGQWYY